jgi:NAD(P)-dependent dehydrogenase (short-subunit alcohol dehydrogenase family)
MMDAPLGGRVAIVTGASRGLGRGMALGLARLGAIVIGPAHIASDFGDLEATDALPGRISLLHADLRRSADCDAVFRAAQDAGGVHILVNNAGLTLTYICPDLYRRPAPPKFWEVSDEVVQNVMDANFVAADKLARRVAPIMVKQGWGRIINVTTMLDTMSRVGFSPYGPSKAALEMASWVWAKELEGTGVTVNVVNPGAGANTPGMAEEMRRASQEGRVDRLVEPEDMVAPLSWVVSREADNVTGMRYDAKQWDRTVPPAEAARHCGRPAGFTLRAPLEPPADPSRLSR